MKSEFKNKNTITIPIKELHPVLQSHPSNSSKELSISQKYPSHKCRSGSDL